MRNRLQPAVANIRRPIATVRGMGEKDWTNYWRDVCAPKLMAKKKELGRKVPEREIAAYVATHSGKRSDRSLVGMWLHGEREPFISQFYALCEKLSLDPEEVLRHPVKERIPLRRVRATNGLKILERKTKSRQ